MRERKRKDTHQMKVYKFRAFLKNDNLPGMLPTAIYQFAKRQQELWNTLATEQERRWAEWKNANPPTLVNDKPQFKKPDKQWWNDFQMWMRYKVAESNLGWEAE